MGPPLSTKPSALAAKPDRWSTLFSHYNPDRSAGFHQVLPGLYMLLDIRNYDLVPEIGFAEICGSDEGISLLAADIGEKIVKTLRTHREAEESLRKRGYFDMFWEEEEGRLVMGRNGVIIKRGRLAYPSPENVAAGLAEAHAKKGPDKSFSGCSLSVSPEAIAISKEDSYCVSGERGFLPSGPEKNSATFYAWLDMLGQARNEPPTPIDIAIAAAFCAEAAEPERYLDGKFAGFHPDRRGRIGLAVPEKVLGSGWSPSERTKIYSLTREPDESTTHQLPWSWEYLPVLKDLRPAVCRALESAKVGQYAISRKLDERIPYGFSLKGVGL